MSQRILVVDDDIEFANFLAKYLRESGFEVQQCHDGEMALNLATREWFDIILLDLVLPGLDGLTVCRQIKMIKNPWVIFISGRKEESDKIVGFHSGADDYLGKPVSIGELLSRIRALLKRRKEGSEDILMIGPIKVDVPGRKVFKNGKTITLRRMEFNLLVKLMQNKGIILSAPVLIKTVWGEDFPGKTETVRAHVRWIREKIEDDPQNPQLIITVRGTGYKFNEFE